MPTDMTATDDMPMDEAEHSMQHHGVSPTLLDSMRQQVEASQKEVERLSALLQKTPTRAVAAADRGVGVAGDTMSDEVSSLGRDDEAPKHNKLLQAIKESKKPSNPTSEEKALWDAYQSSLTNVQARASQERSDLERKVLDSAAQLNQVRVREKILQDQLEDTTRELQSLQKELNNQRSNQEKTAEAQLRRKAEQAMKVRRLEDQLADMESKYKEAQELVETQQEEHERAICAIQRVLADVTSEREKAIEELTATLDEARGAATKAPPPPPGGLSPSVKARAQRAFQLEREMDDLKTMLQTAEKDRDSVQQDLDQKGGNIVILEQELKVVKARLQKAEAKEEDLSKKLEEKSQIVVKLEGELASAKHQVETLIKRDEEMAADSDEKKKEIHKLRRMQRHMRIGESESSHTVSKSEAPAVDVASLRKELEQTHSSLENAKKIITSLESANGSLALDLRSKLKEKEENVQTLQKEATGRTRALDSLATELRDLQRRKDEMDRMDHWSRSLIRKQQVLALQLETALNDLQSAAVIFEATLSGVADSDAIDNISRILANTLGAVKYACMDVNELEKFERTASFDAEVDGMEGSNILRQEVEERKMQVNRLEESLKQERLRHEEETTKQRTEMLMLRDQCKTNLEILAKKERELEVLRDSLDVGDGTGYISDDASSDGEDEGAVEMPVSPGGYSHVQAEAWATLRANGSMDTTALTAEVEKLRKDLKKAALDKEKAAKELKTQRESLANAKMIISSLERANKSMMEDLRQRLQDSNTAIASLLDKSTQSEKQATSLKAELEGLKREKEDEAGAHKKELQKYKDQAIAQALQLAAKDREIQELRRNESTEEPAEESKQ
jgi:chromosome segregation ATPase